LGSKSTRQEKREGYAVAAVERPFLRTLLATKNTPKKGRDTTGTYPPDNCPHDLLGPKDRELGTEGLGRTDSGKHQTHRRSLL